MHHDLQRKTFDKLKKYSEDGHVFITTHSPIFIDKKDYANCFEVIKDGNTTIQNVNARNIRSIITGSLGVGFDELGIFNRFNILTEGQTDIDIILGLNKLFRQKGESDLIEEDETMFIACGSVNAIPHFYDLYNVFNQYGSFYALFDRDKAGIDIRNKMIEKGICKDLLFLITESDHKLDCAIEDIVQKDIWEKCVNFLDDKKLVTIKSKQQKIVGYEYLQKDRVKVKKLFVNKLLEYAQKDLIPFKKYLILIRDLKKRINTEKKT